MNSKDQKKQLTLDNLLPGGKTYRKYTPQMPEKLAWYGDQLTYHKGDSIIIISKKNETKSKTLICLKQINDHLEAKEQLSNLTQVDLVDKSKILKIKTINHTYLFDLEKKQMIAQFSNLSGMDNSDFSNESLLLAYTKENNLYIQNSKGEEITVANEENNRIVYGQSVHQREFGISKGTFWSPNGNYLAFYRMDESMVDVYPLVNTATRMATLKELVYPMAGQKSHHVTVGIYNTKTGAINYLKTGLPKEKFLTNLAWSPDESAIYLAELNRGQDTCIVNCYDITTGRKKASLFTETHPKYVEPEHPVLFLKNDPSKFIWQSKRDGYNHLYLYDIQGNLIKQLTKGNFDITQVLGFDAKGENLFYVSTEASPLEEHAYKTNLKNGKTIKLTIEEGVHKASLSPSGSFICDEYSFQDNPGKVGLINTKTLENSIFHEAKNPFEGATLPDITLGSIKANDNKTDLFYRLVKPANLDENKKYPVVIYVYGGPHSQLVNNSWLGSVRGWDIYMAQKGYIVFTLDNRGTSNRGLDFENITHRQLGVVETQDQMAGVEFLKSLPYVDSDRIGVHGWSYGGFMTLNLMLRHPETFKVGVAGGPVTDWKYYEIMYGERYMDSPKENPEGYKDSSMLNHIGNLQGRLLLIHGDEDPVVLMQHTSELLRAAIKESVHPDLFIYPGHEHNVTGIDRIHLHEHITRYFDDFLK